MKKYPIFFSTFSFALLLAVSFFSVLPTQHAFARTFTSSETSTTITLTATGLTPFGVYKFELSGLGTPDKNTQIIADKDGKAKHTFSPLPSGVYYLAKLHTYNPSTGTYSVDENESLSVGTPEVLALTASNITSKTVKITAKGLTPDATYIFRLSSITGGNFDSPKTKASGVSTLDATFSTLTPNSTYNVNLFLFDPSNGFTSSTGAKAIIFKTLVSDIDITPTLSVTDINPTTATLKATKLTAGATYKFEVANKTTGSTYIQATAVANGDSKAVFSSLTPDTAYTANIFKVDANGALLDVGTIKEVPFKTLPKATTQTLTATDITDSSVKLKATGLDVNIRYSFEIVIPTGNLYREVFAKNDGTAEISFYDGLLQNSSYSANVWKVDAVSGAFLDAGTPTIYFKTLPTAGVDGGVDKDSGLVPCGNETVTVTGPDGKPTTKIKNPCNFYSALKLINTVVRFVFVQLAIPIAAIMFVYAGILLIFSGGATEQMAKAKSIFASVAIGLIIAAIAWLLIHTILDLVSFKLNGFGL